VKSTKHVWHSSNGKNVSSEIITSTND